MAADFVTPVQMAPSASRWMATKGMLPSHSIFGMGLRTGLAVVAWLLMTVSVRCQCAWAR